MSSITDKQGDFLVGLINRATGQSLRSIEDAAIDLGMSRHEARTMTAPQASALISEWKIKAEAAPSRQAQTTEGGLDAATAISLLDKRVVLCTVRNPDGITVDVESIRLVDDAPALAGRRAESARVVTIRFDNVQSWRLA